MSCNIKTSHIIVSIQTTPPPIILAYNPYKLEECYPTHSMPKGGIGVSGKVKWTPQQDEDYMVKIVICVCVCVCV